MLAKDEEVALRLKLALRSARASFLLGDSEAALRALDGIDGANPDAKKLGAAVAKHQEYKASDRTRALETLLAQPRSRPSLGQSLE
jgi:hypothetical protein